LPASTQWKIGRSESASIKSLFTASFCETKKRKQQTTNNQQPTTELKVTNSNRTTKAMYPSIQQIDLTYSDAVDVFSNEAFFEFAAKIDFSQALEQDTYDGTPPPLPATEPTSPKEETCSCCAACCRQRQQSSYTDLLPLPAESPYTNSYYPYTPSQKSMAKYQDSFQAMPMTRPPPVPLMRTLRNRLVWTESLQKRFLQALDYFGLENGE